MTRYHALLLIIGAGLVLSTMYLISKTAAAEWRPAVMDIMVTLTPVDPPEGTATPTMTPRARSYLSPVLKSTFAATPTLEPSPTMGPTETPPPPP